MKPKKPKFLNRYVLAEGYPMVRDSGPTYTYIRMWPVPLNWPKELFHKELPKYRLVLEKVTK